MGTITLSVPDELKSEMDKTDWINWSSVARHAFAETLKDIMELQLRRKIRDISGIPDDDTREVKESVAREVVESIGQTAEELRTGRRRPMTLEELDELMGLK